MAWHYRVQRRSLVILALTSDTNRSTNPSSSERMGEERSSTSAFNDHPLDPDAASNPTTLHPFKMA